MAFDEDGRLYVVEMRWYQSETRGDLMFDERIGRIRLLEDTNGDGRFEKSTIFADRLRYPSAVFPYDGGVYVGLEPDIIYLKDRNGDGVADFRQVVFTGFGNQRDRLDSQTFMNSLTWGLDNRIHGGKGHGGTITSVASPNEPPLDLRGRDFSFDPRIPPHASRERRRQAGTELRRLRPQVRLHPDQRGADADVRGSVCRQESPLCAASRARRYRARARRDQRPAARAPDQPRRSVAPHPESLAGRRRVRRTAASAAGLSDRIERRDPLSRETRSRPSIEHSAFVGVAGNNLVHRRTLVAERRRLPRQRPPDEGPPGNEEFLASTDLWFRPVAFANGPDGALYVADLYREILDFSDGIPESIKRFKDLNRGNDRGRIYRIVPEGFRQPRAAAPREIQHRRARRDAGSSERVAQGDRIAAALHTSGQVRHPGPRAAECGGAVSSGPAPCALCARRSRCAGGGVRAARARRSGSRRAGKTACGCRSASSSGGAGHGLSETLWRSLKARVDDPDLRVRYQLAFTLGEIRHPDRNEALVRLITKDLDQPWMHAAVLSSLAEGAGEVFSSLIARAGAG